MLQHIFFFILIFLHYMLACVEMHMERRWHACMPPPTIGLSTCTLIYSCTCYHYGWCQVWFINCWSVTAIKLLCVVKIKKKISTPGREYSIQHAGAPERSEIIQGLLKILWHSTYIQMIKIMSVSNHKIGSLDNYFIQPLNSISGFFNLSHTCSISGGSRLLFKVGAQKIFQPFKP